MRRPRKAPAEQAATDETLVAWADERAPWARDALRRHATSAGYALSDPDKGAIVERVRHASGMAPKKAPSCEPLGRSHLKGTTALQPVALLCSLGPVKHLNRLAPDEKMRFGIDGLTVILGDNGTGKSGYARVAKKLCRSLSRDELLGNVFEEEEQGPAEVLVRYQVKGHATTEVTWTDRTPTPQLLANIAVFDATNARLYVDRENRISYLPPDISLLQQHGEHCAEMGAAFKAEQSELLKRVRVPLPTGYTPGGAIAQLLVRLDPKQATLPTADEIKALAKADAGDAAKLQQLDLLLANDPAALAARSRRAKAAIEDIDRQLTDAAAALSDAQATTLQGLQDAAQSTAAAAALAASARFASEPLKGVGADPWRLMYDYAKAYAEEIGVSAGKLPDQVGDPCLLCQEPLSEAAATRMQSFNNFVAGEASRAADTARRARDDAIKALRQVQIPTKAQVNRTLAEFAALNEGRRILAAEIDGYCEATCTRRDELLKAAGKADFEAIPALKPSVAAKIAADVAELETEAKTHDAAAMNDNARADDRARQAQLRDCKKLADNLATVLERLDDLIRIRQLQSCCDAVETGPISRQITSLRRNLVMKGLRERIAAEIEALDLSHIPFEINDHSTEGQSLFGVGIKSAIEVENSKVLSEGEQRALALACFLAEATTSGGKHGLIIDDPVSSLDHGRIRRVAGRIVAQVADGHQVIVFTHNILFFNELADAAARMTPPVAVLKNFISKTAAAGFGIVSETNEPWILMSVNKRVTVLRQLLKGYEAINDFGTEDWRRKVTDFYATLRETWERLVEELLLGKVVERFSSDVRTQSLRQVVVEDEDHRTVFHAMKRVSERSGHDMAAGRAVAPPKPTDMKADLDDLDNFRAKIIKRRDATEKARKALENPPKATVA
jgi:energy-coupling factor transporter ATP-binding protein EcfA2